MSRLFNRIGDYRRLNLGINAISGVGYSAILIHQGFNATVIDGFLVAIKCLSGYAHHFAGFRYVAQFVGQV